MEALYAEHIQGESPLLLSFLWNQMYAFLAKRVC